MTQDPHRIDLASERLGAAIVAVNDEFFAPAENLLAAAAPIFDPDRYVSTGKWMDGWETRRRREPGHDWCLIRLGARGFVDEVVVDTSHFKGNFAERCSLEAADLPGQPGPRALEAAEWTEILPESRLRGDSANPFSCSFDRPVTHLRLRIYPDGGVARLRAYGRVQPDWDRIDFSAELADLIAIENGGRVLDATDVFFAPATNLLLPGPSTYMGDGWESKRRRGPGHDAVTFRLGAAGEILRVELSTRHFKGNAPARFALDVCDDPQDEGALLADDAPWRPLLHETSLQPHARHIFDDALEEAGRATHARLRIVPDGGVARLRLFGRTERARELLLGLGRRNAESREERRAGLHRCCGSSRWAEEMARAGPFSCPLTLMRAADRVWRSMERDDILEAFSAHPKIGEKKASGWSQKEQAGAAGAAAGVLERLAQKNRDYEERFGYIFIVCASGKSADEMLALLERRLANDPDRELPIAAEEQRKITRLRLERWLRE